MKDRIRSLRKELNLTQQEFADRLGIKRGAVANYEIGRNAPIDAVISLICKTFSVNSDWLRNGEGGMFDEERKEDDLLDWARDVLGNEPESFQRRFVAMLARLNGDEWKLLEKMAATLAKEAKENPVPKAETRWERDARLLREEADEIEKSQGRSSHSQEKTDLSEQEA